MKDTGSRFGFEAESASFPGAQTSCGGETIILINPRFTAGDDFAIRAGQLFGEMAADGNGQLLGTRRHRRRADDPDRTEIKETEYRMLPELAGRTIA